MQSPRLVATDVDGTLLGDAAHPSERTCAVLGRMEAAGVPLVLATGRPPRWVRPLCDGAGIHGLVVAANGAVLYDEPGDRVLAAETLAGDVLAEVATGLDAAVPGGGLAVERVGRGVGDADVVPFLHEPSFGPLRAPVPAAEVDRADLLRDPVIKVLVRHPTQASDVMAAAARQRVGHLVDVTWSTLGGLVECAVRGVTKATGLAHAAARLGVARDDVVAFGDMPNDVEMLRWAGHGVAMGNAHPDVLAAADEVTGSNLDDGVASVLERWF